MYFPQRLMSSILKLVTSVPRINLHVEAEFGFRRTFNGFSSCFNVLKENNVRNFIRKINVSRNAMMVKEDGDAVAVLPTKYGAGPHGLGDPDDRTLRRVEVEILIPRKMRDKAKAEKCAAEVEDFVQCCKDRGLGMVVRCRKENSLLKDCLTRWYDDKEFKKSCEKEYLDERSAFRRTGIRTKDSMRKESTTF